MSVQLASRIAGCAASALTAGLFAAALYRYFASLYGKDRIAAGAGRVNSSGARGALIAIFAAFVVSRALILAGGMLAAHIEGNLENYLRYLPDMWTRWDGDHYVGLIKNWYVNEGDPRYHIVFFPLYPALCRLIHLATGLDAELTAYIVSNAAFYGCGVMMYLLVRRSFGGRAGLRAALILMFSPLTLFCSLPYTESLFLLTTLASVYFARRKMFALAVVFGALSANARLAGMATAIPIFWEMLDSSKARGVRKYAVCTLKTLPVSAGLLMYIGLNYAVTGDAFRFMDYQKNHWGQAFGSVGGTVSYTLSYAFEYENALYRAWLWTPQLIILFLALALLYLGLRRLKPGDLAYGAVYYYVSVVPTWLLSGSRYLSAMYPLYVVSALLTKNKWVFRALLTILALLCALFGAGYSVKGYVL